MVSVMRFVLLFSLLIGAPSLAMAQSDDAGSLYSRFGLGELQAFSSSQIQGLGGEAPALWSFNYANFENPAALGFQALTRLNVNARMQRLWITDATNANSSLRAGSLGAVQFSLPLLTNKLGIGASFSPYSRVGYRVQTLGEIVIDPVQDETASYTINYEGSGGLQKIAVGGGYRITPHLSLGLAGNMIFGIIEEGRRTTFQAAPTFSETNVSTITQYRGVSGTLGLLYTHSRIFREEDNISVGASFSLPFTLDGERALTLGESLDRDTLESEITGNLEIPMSLQFGVAYKTDNRWTAVLSGRYEPWSQFDGSLSVPGFSPEGLSQFQDRLRVSGGLEVIPAGSDVQAPFFQRIAYRLGAYYDQSYITPDEDLALRTAALTTGMSIPTLFAGTHLDINIEVGTRGSAAGTFVRDRFVGLSATLNIGERWFTRRKLR